MVIFMDAFASKILLPRSLTADGHCAAEAASKNATETGSADDAGQAREPSAAMPPITPSSERLVIEETVAQVFGVSGRDLRQATRGRADVARARQVAMYLTHVTCGMSLTQVGRTFARDRTTVSHACGVIEDGRDDPIFDRVLELLEQVVQTLVNARSHRHSTPGGWLLQ